jgi:hypothetical protein
MRLDDSKHLHNNVVWQSTNIKCSPSHQLKNQVVSHKYFMYVYCTLVKRPANHLTLPVTYVGHFRSSAHYVFSLKTNLFYKIHLQAFNVISIVLYHSAPTFGQVLYFCLDAFVVDASDYSGHLIRHLLNASEAFPTVWFLQNKSKSGGLSTPDFDLFPKLKEPFCGKCFRSTEEVSNEVT